MPYTYYYTTIGDDCNTFARLFSGVFPAPGKATGDRSKATARDLLHSPRPW